jgi:hypothetical protein
MTDGNPQPGGSCVGCKNAVQQQNVVIDPTAKNAAAQLAQRSVMTAPPIMAPGIEKSQ